MHLHVHVAFCEHLVVLLCVHETVHIFNFFFLKLQIGCNVVIFSFGVWTESMCILKTLNKQPLCHMFVGFLSYRPKKTNKQKTPKGWCQPDTFITLLLQKLLIIDQ